MAFHVALPNDGDPSLLIDLAVQAEELGFVGAWVAEHVLPPKGYPDPSYDSEYDPFTLLSFLASRTTTIRLGTSVVVLPLRNPFVLAKQVASVDALSGGRFELGIGVGWDPEEFAAVGETFTNRGRRTDEAIALLRNLWSGGDNGFHGDFYSYEKGDFTPVRPAGIPISVGGFSEHAIQRAIRLGDAWQSINLDGAGSTFEHFAKNTQIIKERTNGRVRSTIKRYVRDAAQTDALVDEIPRWLEAGADDIVVWFGQPQVFADLQSRFADQIQPGVTA